MIFGEGIVEYHPLKMEFFAITTLRISATQFVCTDDYFVN